MQNKVSNYLLQLPFEPKKNPWSLGIVCPLRNQFFSTRKARYCHDHDDFPDNCHSNLYRIGQLNVEDKALSCAGQGGGQGGGGQEGGSLQGAEGQERGGEE